MSVLSSLLGRNPKGFVRRWQGTIDEHVISLAWSPDGTTLAAAAVGGPISVFDANTGTVRQQWKGHGFGTTGLAYRPNDSTVVASTGQDGKAKVWKLGNNDPTLTLAGGASWVERLAWSPNSQFLATAAGKKLRLWNQQGEMTREYPDHSSTIADLQWRPGTNELAVASYGAVTVWTPDTTTPRQCYQWQGSTLALAWHPKGTYIATGDQDRTVHFWITKTGEDLQMSGYQTKVLCLSWDATGRWLATSGSNVPCVWDCSRSPAGTQPLMFEGHDGNLTALAFQRAGAHLVSGDSDGLVCLWQPGKYKIVMAQQKLSAGVTQLQWAPDDRALAIGCEDGMIAVLGVL